MNSKTVFLSVFSAILIVSFSGCVEVRDCGKICDDNNPCTIDDCRKDIEGCLYTPLEGPQKGCMGEEGGCIHLTCFDGECARKDRRDCCGNNICEEQEGQMSCPQDCFPTCNDLIKNQGEIGVDCGGPCENACESCDDGIKNFGEGGVDCAGPCEKTCDVLAEQYFGEIQDLREKYHGLAEEYSSAIEKFNENHDLIQLGTKAKSVKDRMGKIEDQARQIGIPKGFEDMHSHFLENLKLYISSIENMILYTENQRERYRLNANSLQEEAIDADGKFVRSFNLKVEFLNKKNLGCSNGALDAQESGIDCGGICIEPCSRQVELIKIISFHNKGDISVDLTANVTPSAIPYPPYQEILNIEFSIEPAHKVKDVEGNQFYQYTFPLKPGQVKEIRIIQEVKINRGKHLVSDSHPAFFDDYLEGDEYTQLTKEICEKARELRSESSSGQESAENFFSWITENIKYTFNREELGSDYSFKNRIGACDEHADLFNSFFRCIGVPARRVTGYLMNGSELSGHAWSEYYDADIKGWRFIEPTIQGGKTGYNYSDGSHIISCVGKKAYRCGVGYHYSYEVEALKKEPIIKVDEHLFIKY
ncbi:MAG: transglutaminase-like domain-containing protein [Candidatus Altiarchaeota archaeon]